MPKKAKAQRQVDTELREKIINEYILNQPGEFDVDVAVRDIIETHGFDDDEEDVLYGVFVDSNHLFSYEAEDGMGEIAISRCAFFKNAKLRIKLTPYEYENKILFPGHRFIPYLNEFTLPYDLTLKDPAGDDLPKKCHECALDDAVICHTLFGQMDMLVYFSIEQENWDQEMEDVFQKEICHLTVFDMSALFDTHDVQKNDTFIVTLDDWREATFSIEHQPQSTSIDFAGIAQWCDAMEGALLEVFDEHGPDTLISEQIAHAYFKGPEILRSVPAIHFGGFLAQTKAVSIAQCHQTSVLWRKDEDPAPVLMEKMMQESLTDQYFDDFDDSDMLEDALHAIGIAVEEDDVELFMKDALAAGETDWRSVLERMTVGRPGTVFDDDSQKNEFFGLMEELWNEVRESYDPAEDVRARPLREKVTAACDAQLAFFRKLDSRHANPMDIPTELMTAMTEIFGKINSMKEILCGLEPLTTNNELLDSATELVDAITLECEQVMDEILKRTPTD